MVNSRPSPILKEEVIGDWCHLYNGDCLEIMPLLEEKSIDMIRLLGKYGGIATGKAYMKMVDMNCGAFRLPVQNMSDESFELFKNDVASLNFNEFCSTHP